MPDRRSPESCTNARLHVRRAIAFLLVLASAGGAASAWAHDFWIVPNAFVVARGNSLAVRGQTSSLFPTSESAVTTDRVASARLIGSRTATAIRALSVVGPSLVLSGRPPGVGQYVVAVQLLPRTVRESPESFRRYLQLEGAPEALARYEREGRLPIDSITRRYAKYAKAFIEVGARGGRAFGRTAGHPTEMTPLTDPARLRVGDTLRVRLTFRGTGVPKAHVHAGAVPVSMRLTDTTGARVAAGRDVSLTADQAGVASLVIDRAGLWNLRNIHIVPADPGSGADWDVHWATLVFRVGAR